MSEKRVLVKLFHDLDDFPIETMRLDFSDKPTIEYVVWEYNKKTGNCFGGLYTPNVEAAKEVFIELGF